MVVDDAIDLPALPVTAVGPRPGSSLPIASSRPEDRVELGDALAMHTPVLLATARVLVRNEPDARDLVQTTLEIAARKVGDLRDPAALRSWGELVPPCHDGITPMSHDFILAELDLASQTEAMLRPHAAFMATWPEDWLLPWAKSVLASAVPYRHQCRGPF
jgi:hypothetical protein